MLVSELSVFYSSVNSSILIWNILAFIVFYIYYLYFNTSSHTQTNKIPQFHYINGEQSSTWRFKLKISSQHREKPKPIDEISFIFFVYYNIFVVAKSKNEVQTYLCKYYFVVDHPIPSKKKHSYYFFKNNFNVFSTKMHAIYMIHDN